MPYILFDTPTDRANLMPFTLIRPIAGIRIGILSIAEKWEKYLKMPCDFATEAYLQSKYEVALHSKDATFINGSVCPNPDLLAAIEQLKVGQQLLASQNSNTLLAYRGKDLPSYEVVFFEGNYTKINFLYDIFTYNGEQIQADFHLLTHNRKSQGITDPHTIVYQPENIFVEEGAKLKACVLNAEKGVIYIGKNAQVQELSVIQGNFALCEGAVVNIGGKMRGDTTIGPFCKVGGEISNSVFFAYSNKAHDGFLGNSVIGEWCNLGADTNTSNLKNNYGEVKIWNFLQKDFLPTGKQFCGLMMGDFSKAGINTMFNTGTVVGLSANIFGGGFPPKYIPSFAWGGAEGFEVFDFEKSIEVTARMMQRRNQKLSEAEVAILRYVFDNERQG
ncbi:MAG: GlmU family protein [Raineya sp.]